MKRRGLSFVIIVVLLLSFSCNSEEKKGASSMLDTANQYFKQEKYDEALQVLDSLNKTYPKEVEAREQALSLRRTIRLVRSSQDSLQFSHQLEILVQFTDSLYREFVLVEVPGMPDENIIRYKGYNPSASNEKGTFLDCYIANDGTLELIAATSGRRIEGIAFIAVNESVGNTFVTSDTLAYDGGVNYRFENLGHHYERLTYTGDRAIKVAGFIANAPEDSTIKVTFGLENGKLGKSFILNPTAREAISKSYKYAKGLIDIAELQRSLDTHTRRLLLENERRAKEATK